MPQGPRNGFIDTSGGIVHVLLHCPEQDIHYKAAQVLGTKAVSLDTVKRNARRFAAIDRYHDMLERLAAQVEQSPSIEGEELLAEARRLLEETA